MLKSTDNYTMGFAFLLWLALAVIAVTNGYIGTLGVGPLLGEPWVEPYKVLVIVTAIFFAAWIYLRQRRDRHPGRSAIVLSTTWVSLTVLFEFVFGHYVAGNSWEDLLAAYRFWEGHLWVLVLLSEAIAPFLVSWRSNPLE